MASKTSKISRSGQNFGKETTTPAVRYGTLVIETSESTNRAVRYGISVTQKAIDPIPVPLGTEYR
jgi:hypothetical protein